MKRKKNEVDPENPPLTDSDLKRGRRVTPDEHEMFARAVQSFRSRGRPKKISGKYRPVTIRLHPDVLQWARTEAKKRGLGYQTVINQTLLCHAV
jgi:uncharacterized protein (DUF4415 family)